ncbi:MAG: C1 family peptidase [Bacteroidales bacterium]
MKKLLLITLTVFGILFFWPANLTGSLSETPEIASSEITSLPATLLPDEAYTLTFDKQGGSGGTDQTTATIGYPMPLAAAPAKENFVFAGYYDATTGGTQYYTSAMASARDWDKTANTTLYARWTTLPSSFSWGNAYGHNWISTVKNQGSCGACWAFSLAASYEARKRIIENNPSLIVDLSEQHMVSCWVGSCAGGGTYEHLNKFINEGVPDEACFPYTSSGGSPPACSSGCADWATRAYRIADWVHLYKASASRLKSEIMVSGPIYATMEVYTDFFSYTGGVYVHTSGTLSGTKAFIVYGWDDAEDCWLVVNTWGTNWGETGPGGTKGFFRVKIDGNNCKFAESGYVLSAERDPVLIFTTPSTQATTLQFTKVLETELNIAWTNGNGMGRAVFMMHGTAGTPAPVNNTTYSANTAFGSGAQIGTTGWYCVYNGTGTTVNITGLTPDNSYRAMVCEYNGTPGKEKYNTVIATGNPATFLITSVSDALADPLDNVKIYPVPFSENINLVNIESIEKITLTSLSGQTIRIVEPKGAQTLTIPAGDIGSGTYLLNFHLPNGEVVVKRIVKYREPG